MHETRTVRPPNTPLDPSSLYRLSYPELSQVSHYLCVPFSSRTNHPEDFSLAQIIAANRERAIAEIENLFAEGHLLADILLYFPHYLGVREMIDRKWGEFEYTLFSVMVMVGLTPEDAEQLQKEISIGANQLQTINAYSADPAIRWQAYQSFADTILAVVLQMPRAPKTLVPLAFADQSFGGRLEMYLADKLDIPRLR